jgi:hypothetical protein
MNRFELHGTVVKVEVKRGPRQEWYLVSLETDHEDVVGIPVFSDPPRIGSRCWATGHLSSHDGYLRLIVEKLKVVQRARRRPPLPVAERPGR